MSHAVAAASASADTLAEGPVWGAARSGLLWVDIEDGQIFSTERDDGTLDIELTVHVADTAGVIAVSPECEWVIAGSRGLLFRATSGQITPGSAILSGESTRRLNDGKPDPVERFPVDSRALRGASSHEILVVVDLDGSVRTIDNDLRLSNGVTSSAGRTTLYSVDSEGQVVFRRDYDASTGCTGARQRLLSCDNGYPDGVTIDADDPCGSRCGDSAKCGDTLRITTATQDLTNEQHAQRPYSGHVFTIKPAVGRIPLPLWNGIYRPPTFTRNT